MSTAATSRPARSSWNAHAQDRPRQRPSTTPHGLPMRTPVSVGQSQPPVLSPNARSPKSSQDPRTPSPNYFGFVVDSSNDPPGSNPGNHTKKNWDFPSSSVRTAAPPTTRAAPLDANPDFELFRRQSETNSFSLGHGSLSHFTNSRSSDHSSDAGSRPQSPRSGKALQQRDKENQFDFGDGAVVEKSDVQSPLNIPRNNSPANFASIDFAPNTASHQLPRLSLPQNTGANPSLFRHPQRAETLPSSVQNGTPKMMGVQEFADLAENKPEEILLLDLRVYPQFSQSRIQGALNLCIPTTLLKRPSFNLQKLADTFTDDKEKQIFEAWRQCKYIVVYDANSYQQKDAISSVNILKKFSNEGFRGQGCIIRGGFSEFSKKYSTLIDRNQSTAKTSPTKSHLSIAPPGPGAAPVAGGCPMPNAKSAANPFFGNIRQNMDLIGGVGQMPIKHPSSMTDLSEATLPQWLRKAAETSNKGKDVSDKFLEIEKAEQTRMQQALSGNVSYGSPHPSKSSSVQIAGIEKGSKNRYNNIFPYDHTRVKLEDCPIGSCDYFNASYVKTAYSNKRYIATQAPIPATFNDFWRVIWEQDVRVIVMLTAESEGGQVKSHPYWHASDYGPLKIKSLSEKKVNLETTELPHPATTLIKRPSLGQRRSTNPHTMAEKKDATEIKSPSSEIPFVQVRKFTLSHNAFPFQPMREITQLQYSNWPDFGAPAHPAHLLGIIEQTAKMVRETNPNNAIPANEAEPEGQRPLVVHCSAGCGRTGTFCTVDSVIDMLKKQRMEREVVGDKMDVDSEDNWINRDDQDLVARAVDDFRRQRLSMVQSLRQFVLCYESVLEWLVSPKLQNLQTGNKGEIRRSYQG